MKEIMKEIMTSKLMTQYEGMYSVKEIITALIFKAFKLKCLEISDTMVLAFAEEAIKNGFSPAEIEKACEEVSYDSSLRKIIYADIYERAKPLRNERLNKAKETTELANFQAEQEAQEKRLDSVKITDEVHEAVAKWANKIKQPIPEGREMKETYLYLKDTGQL